MAELRYNNSAGTLGASLTSSSTTITFATAPDFATLSGSDYIKLVLDAGTASFEIVYLTAYTSGGTTGTITRAAEDSTNWPATSHSSGTGTWACSPTLADFGLNTPDQVRSGNRGYDYYFQAESTSLPATTGGGAASWYNQAGNTYNEELGVGSITIAEVLTTTDGSATGVYWSPPSAPYTITAKMSAFIADENYSDEYFNAGGGLFLTDGTKYWCPAYGAGYNGYILASASTATATQTVTRLGPSGQGVQFPPVPPAYNQIVVHSATDVDIELSADGVNFQTLASGLNPGFTPSGFGFLGFCFGGDTTSTLNVSLQWLIVR